MSSTITSPTLLDNQSPVNGRTTASECDTYTHQLTYETDTLFERVKLWGVIGSLPNGITLDPSSGLLSGQLLRYDYQDACIDNYPNETMNIDGSNWTNTGRYRYDSHTFEFTIVQLYYDIVTGGIITDINGDYIVFEEIQYYVLTDENGMYIMADDIRYEVLDEDETILLERADAKDTSIILNRNNDIDTFMFFKAYVESGYGFATQGVNYPKNDVDFYLTNQTFISSECI